MSSLHARAHPHWRPPRLPAAPLLAMMDGSNLAKARHLGIHHRQLYRWIEYGLTANQADIMATRLGHHPMDIWGDDWLALCEED